MNFQKVSVEINGEIGINSKNVSVISHQKYFFKNSLVRMRFSCNTVQFITLKHLTITIYTSNIAIKN